MFIHLIKLYRQSIFERGLWKTLRGSAEYWRHMHLRSQRRFKERLRLETEDGFDARYGTETTELMYPYQYGLGQRGRGLLSNASLYWPTLPRTFPKMMAELPIAHEDYVFIDLGSGKGRTLLLASEYPFKRLVGVEISPAMCAVAERNIALYRSETQRSRHFEILCTDATAFTFTGERAVIYLFEPFSRSTLHEVAERLRASLDEHPRQVFVIYHLPTNADVFGFLRPIREVPGDWPENAAECPWTIFATTTEKKDCP